MAYYFVRHDSMTQATTTFNAVETGADGSTAGPISVPREVKMIKTLTVSFSINSAMITNTGPIFVLRLTGTGALPDGQQDLIIGALHLDDGGGTLTYTENVMIPPVIIPCSIRLNGGSNLTLQAAYYGTDAGSPEISVELELV